MLTDIFAFRYATKLIWSSWGTKEKRLLVQAFSLVKDMNPYYDYKGKESPTGKAFWKSLHDRMAVELGVKTLHQTYYSYPAMYAGKQTTVSGSFTWLTVCENWVHSDPLGTDDADAFIKERLSLVEVAIRLKEEELARANAELPNKIAEALARPRGGLRVPGDPREGLVAWNKTANDTFRVRVEELNTRFRQAGCKLHYHNGYIQLSEDPRIQEQLEAPFWKIVSDEKWKNVDTDMKEAIDRRDNGERDPAWYAARALESAIKIISDENGWTHGDERGAHNFIDNLAKRDARYITPWEAAALKAIFTDLRNPFGHGPGSAEMPTLTPQQVDLAIEVCMSWVKSLVKRA